MSLHVHDQAHRARWLLLALALLSLGLTALGASVGSTGFDSVRRWAEDPLAARIVWDIRLPRAVLAVLIGAVLAMSGAALQGLLRTYVPWWIAQRYQLAFIDIEGKVLAARPDQLVSESSGMNSYDIAFAPPGYGLRLRAVMYQTGWPFWQQALYGVLAGLSGRRAHPLS